MLIPECSECYSSYCRCENLFDPYYYEDVFNDWDYYSEYIDYEGIYDFNYNYSVMSLVLIHFVKKIMNNN